MGLVDIAASLLAHWLGVMEEVGGVSPLLTDEGYPDLCRWARRYIANDTVIREAVPAQEGGPRCHVLRVQGDVPGHGRVAKIVTCFGSGKMVVLWTCQNSETMITNSRYFWIGIRRCYQLYHSHFKTTRDGQRWCSSPSDLRVL
jgi:hypothetical protein